MERLITMIALLSTVAAFVVWLLGIQVRLHELEMNLDNRMGLIEERHRTLCVWVADDFYRGEPTFGCQ